MKKEKFKQILLGNDIPKYLNEVEAEAIRILQAYNLPTQIKRLSSVKIYETITGEKLIDTVKVSPQGKFTYKLPIEIYQAKGVLVQVAAARHQRQESEIHDDFTGIARDYHALAVAKIGRIVSFSTTSSARGTNVGLSNKGKEKPFTRYMREAIAMTPVDQIGSKFDAVIGTIRYYNNDEIEIESVDENRLGVTRVRYYDITTGKECSAAKRTLANHIYKK